LEKEFRTEFVPIVHEDVLRLLLEKRKRLDDEQPMAYINEAESICRSIDSEMSQQEMTRHITKGLKPNIARDIGLLDNSSLKLLKDNVRKYEMIEFIVTREINQSPSEIKTDIITQKLNRISNELNDKINQLNENSNKLKKDLENITKPQARNNNFNKPNNFKINRNFLPNSQMTNNNI